MPKNEDIQAIVDQVRDVVQDMPALWQTWKSGQRPASEVLDPLMARIRTIVEHVGRLHPDLADRKERERIVVAVIVQVLDTAGVDIPFVPDDQAVKIMVRFAVYAWRFARTKSKSRGEWPPKQKALAL